MSKAILMMPFSICIGQNLIITCAIRCGADEGGEHLYSCSWVSVSAQSFIHLPSEPLGDIHQVLIRQSHVIQVLIHLRKPNEG